jgi:O-antigen biosynthesis protein
MANVFGMITCRSSGRYTLPALRSFFDRTPWQEGDEFLLIDNDAAFDQTLVSTWGSKLKIIVNAKPESFASNANRILSRADSSSADAYVLNNDLMFTSNWLSPLAGVTAAVVTPACNQNFCYQLDGFVLKPLMVLEDYLGRERHLDRIVEGHSLQHTREYVQAYRTNYFCVKIPVAVYRSVGLFDSSNFQNGGEDDDYSVRAYLRGFRVVVAAESYLLHFGGLSTWRGGETPEEEKTRIQNFTASFRKKWGPTLSRLLLWNPQGRDVSILENDPSLQAIQQRAGIAALFAEIIRRDGVDVSRIQQ